MWTGPVPSSDADSSYLDLIYAVVHLCVGAEKRIITEALFTGHYGRTTGTSDRAKLVRRALIMMSKVIDHVNFEGIRLIDWFRKGWYIEYP